MDISRDPTTVLRVETVRGPIFVIAVPQEAAGDWQSFILKLPGCGVVKLGWHQTEQRFARSSELQRVMDCHPSDVEILTDLVRRYAELT